MNTGVISVRYARALYKSVADETTLDRVYADMTRLASTFIEVPALRRALDNPMLGRDEKQKLVVLATGGSPSKATEAFLHLVLKEGREELLQFMANSFVTLYRESKNLVSSRLVTATAVAPEVEVRMRKLVESRTNAKVEMQTEVNPDIIGGFILEYDTYRMDASVQTQLRTILKELC